MTADRRTRTRCQSRRDIHGVEPAPRNVIAVEGEGSREVARPPASASDEPTAFTELDPEIGVRPACRGFRPTVVELLHTFRFCSPSKVKTRGRRRPARDAPGPMRGEDPADHCFRNLHGALLQEIRLTRVSKSCATYESLALSDTSIMSKRCMVPVSNARQRLESRARSLRPESGSESESNNGTNADTYRSPRPSDPSAQSSAVAKGPKKPVSSYGPSRA